MAKSQQEYPFDKNLNVTFNTRLMACSDISGEFRAKEIKKFNTDLWRTQSIVENAVFEFNENEVIHLSIGHCCDKWKAEIAEDKALAMKIQSHDPYRTICEISSQGKESYHLYHYLEEFKYLMALLIMGFPDDTCNKFVVHITVLPGLFSCPRKQHH
ncbi:hypothetical protein QYM36_002140 [Artemia franciscana]|uniref:Uncharacterized protein n=1 Tax=Artemia franciscana TaxID=6661 RepID=A0AA88IL42_ARTSF|nr:hypothetical protein QYM36_002140 [Artemia franciscana]